MKRGWILAVVALAVVGALVVGWGLTGSVVSGSVVRARDGEPVENAIVEIDGEPIATSATSFSTRLSLGDHSIALSAPGYESVSKPVKVAFFRRSDLGAIGLRNADLRIKVVENYPGYPDLKTAKLTISGRSIESTGGEVSITDLPVGDLAISATAPDCQDASMTVELRAGENSVVCTLTPTLESVVKRSAQNVIDRDLALTYANMHPARQKQWGTEADYVRIIEKRDKENEGMVNVVGFKVLTSRMLATYKDKPSNSTYENVYSVPISFRVSSPLLALFGQKEMSMKLTNYWVLVDGRWRDLGDGEKVDKK